MFDIGFSELMVIAVALIVIGPERLPRVARTMGHLFGRLQRYVNDVKADINREIELDELRKFKSSFEDAARSVEQDVHSEATKAQSELDSLTQIGDPASTAGLSNPGAVTPEPKAPKTEAEQTGRSIEQSSTDAAHEPGQAPDVSRQKSAA